jgi:hypothetical protein
MWNGVPAGCARPSGLDGAQPVAVATGKRDAAEPRRVWRTSRRGASFTSSL